MRGYSLSSVVWFLEFSCHSIFPEQLRKGHFSFSSWCPIAKDWAGYRSGWLSRPHKASDRGACWIRSHRWGYLRPRRAISLVSFAQWLLWFWFAILPERGLCTPLGSFPPLPRHCCLSHPWYLSQCVAGCAPLDQMFQQHVAKLLGFHSLAPFPLCGRFHHVQPLPSRYQIF